MANNPPAGPEDNSKILGILQAKEIIEDQLYELDQTNDDRERTLAQAIATDLSPPALVNIDAVVARRATEAKTADDAYQVKVDGYKRLHSLLSKRLKELKRSKPATLKKVLSLRIQELEQKVLAAKDTTVLDRQITELKNMLKTIK